MHIPYHYYVPTKDAQDMRDAIFYRMEKEALLSTVMAACDNPTLADWRQLTDPAKAWLLLCEHKEHGHICGVGLFTPWRWRVWEFDFVTFAPQHTKQDIRKKRTAYAQEAVAMAKGGFAYMFAHAPVDSIIGVCPVTHRHAHRLATACGFTVMGKLAGACWIAKQKRYVDGVMVALQRPENEC